MADGTYSLGAVARITGLSPHVLRSWERRYGAVSPARTPGGTRRYADADVARLKLLASAVRAGHSIGTLSALSDEELRQRLEMVESDGPRPDLGPVLHAVADLDADALERMLGLQLAALGSERFLDLVVDPLLEEVGDRWAEGTLCIASEHLASSAIRTLLGASLRRRSGVAASAPTLFTTLSGDQHELGALACAVLAAESGVNAVYLGPDLPASEIARAVETTGARRVVVGMSWFAEERERTAALAELRQSLPPSVEVWAGGPGSEIEAPAGVNRMASRSELVDRLQGSS